MDLMALLSVSKAISGPGRWPAYASRPLPAPRL